MRIRDLPKVEAVLKGSTGAIDFVVVRFENYKRFVRKCNLEGSIDEAEYLARYKDVEKAIRDGKVRTATEHYLNTGYAEQRVAQISDSPQAQSSTPRLDEFARVEKPDADAGAGQERIAVPSTADEMPMTRGDVAPTLAEAPAAPDQEPATSAQVAAAFIETLTTSHEVTVTSDETRVPDDEVPAFAEAAEMPDGSEHATIEHVPPRRRVVRGRSVLLSPRAR